MIEKELMMRLIMLKAATEKGVNHRRLSLRCVQQVVLAFVDNSKDLDETNREGSNEAPNAPDGCRNPDTNTSSTSARKIHPSKSSKTQLN